MEELVPWLWIIVIALVFWLLVIRPASRRQKELVRMQSALSVGDEVLLTSGVYGTIAVVADDHLMVTVAPEVTLKVARGAVGGVVPGQREDAEPGEEPRRDESEEL